MDHTGALYQKTPKAEVEKNIVGGEVLVGFLVQ